MDVLRPLLVTLLLLAAAAGSAMAGGDKPILPPEAFKSVPGCLPIDPFVDATPERQERSIGCDAELPLTMAVRTPRRRATDTGPDAVELEVDRQLSLSSPGFTAAARFGMKAASEPADRRLQPQRALFAASSTLKFSELFSVELGMGRNVLPTPKNRATATAIFRPEGRHLLYLQVAEEEDRHLGPALGMRWRLGDEGEAVLDLSARRMADDSVEPRVGLRWTH
jgi:hypothetical protein